MIVELLAIFGSVAGFIAVTLAIASGLYYLSEVVEENTEFTGRLLNRTIKGISITLVLLWLIDGFPFKLTALSLFSYFIYYQNLRRFPNINLTGPNFILTCILAVLNHVLWYQHFTNPYIPSIDERLKPDFKMPRYTSFPEVASFFGLCIWLIPFALFISISANENRLPTSMGDLDGTNSKSGDEKVQKSVNLVKWIIFTSVGKVNGFLRQFGFSGFTRGQSNTNPNEMFI
ncbi:hypothetical protein CANARDRAFT_29914 [[Candida] arabinofermentans NRRL YB-2248]|uniref:Protein SVP26 n=1 Tax=[Candida] arabinofermentans NRRL YB-2248 TaxID=983967 RepID=A0A1E4SVC9_9ASCO|nr:hypothetical protein CANARDRAFT_29914 [[Candida] arabinofermentans NRRL YB-2248]